VSANRPLHLGVEDAAYVIKNIEHAIEVELAATFDRARTTLDRGEMLREAAFAALRWGHRKLDELSGVDAGEFDVDFDVDVHGTPTTTPEVP
jgi:hypothetical protein